MIHKLLSAAVLCLGALSLHPGEQATKGPFTSTTIDFGIVVRDIEASARFYGETLGMQELEGFSVGAEFCRDAGLTDSKPLSVRVFVLGQGEGATKVKLMQVGGVESKASDNRFIHSQLGLSYLTLYVRNLGAAMERLGKAGVQPMAKSPVPLGESPDAPQLLLVRDPDGNILELIGPRT